MLQPIRIFTDGSCLGNPGPGGWSALIERPGENMEELAGGYALTTNNRMEIISVIEALRRIDEPGIIEIFSDSQYVCNSIEKKWLAGWIRKNWVNAKRQPVKNKDLWLQLLPHLKKHEITMHWVQGHAGHPQNERCDLLARSYASRSDLPEDPGFVTPD